MNNLFKIFYYYSLLVQKHKVLSTEKHRTVQTLSILYIYIIHENIFFNKLWGKNIP